MNWDTIKYIFQIPLGWYKSIHDKVFNAYGTNFIKVRDGDDGAMQIDVDEATFNEAVMRVAGGGVRSVDGITPDPDGNIPLSAVRTINNEAPDANGNIDIELSGTVTSVNDIAPDLNGNVDLGELVYTVNGTTPDEDGNVDVGTVKSVDNIQPDVDGNVSLTGFVKSVNSTGPDQSGNVTVDVGVKSVNLLAPDQTGNVSIPALYTINGVAPPVYSHNFDGVVFSVNSTAPDAYGNVEIDVGEGSVKSVNGEEPDANGNVEVDVGVKKVNSISPDANGNVEVDVGVKSVDGYLPDPNTGNVDLGVVLAINDQLPDANGDVYLTGFVKSVDGHYPDENGAVDFGLTANKWLKSNTQGQIATTDDVPIVKDSTTKGYIYNNHGTIEYKDEEYVDLTSDQTITGRKTFNNDVAIHNDGSLLVAGSTAGTSVSKNGITITSQTIPFIALSKSGTAAYDSFILLSPTFNDLNLQSPIGINIDTPANKAALARQPTDTSTSSLAIATCGYVQTQALTLSGDQIITGQKTFKKELRIGFDGIRDVNSRTREVQGLRFRDGTPDKFIVGQVECELASNGNNILRQYVYKNVGGSTLQVGNTYWIDNNGNQYSQLYTSQHTFGGSDRCRVIFNTTQNNCHQTFLPSSTATYGGAIDFRYAGADSATGRIADYQNELQIRSYAKNLQLYTDSPNQAVLTQTPTILFSDRTSKAIATCGWVNTILANNMPNMEKVVYTNTTQTISGQKTFTATKTYTNNIEATGSITATGTVSTGSESVGSCQLEYGRLFLNQAPPVIYLTNTSTGSQCSIRMAGSHLRLYNSVADIQLYGRNVVCENHPPASNSTDAKNVATTGWCNNKFGKVKTVNGNLPDSNGNVIVEVTLSNYVSWDEFNTKMQDYSTTAEIYDNYYTWSEIDDMLTSYAKTNDLTAYAKTTDLTAYAKSVDGHTVNSSGEINFGLHPNRWLKTDANGHIHTTDETPIAIDPQQYTPQSGIFTVCTGVTWNGTALKYKSENWTFVNGVLVNIASNSDTTIDTPVAYSAS